MIQIGTPNHNLVTNRFLDGAMTARLYGSMSVSMTLSPPPHFWSPAGSADPTPPRHAGPAGVGRPAAGPADRQAKGHPRPPAQQATEPLAAAGARAAEHRAGHQTPADPADGFFV